MACLCAETADGLVGLKPARPAGSTAIAAPWEFVAATPALPRQPLTALRDGTAARIPGRGRDHLLLPGD
jgi:hypothetical protein